MDPKERRRTPASPEQKRSMSGHPPQERVFASGPMADILQQFSGRDDKGISQTGVLGV